MPRTTPHDSTVFVDRAHAMEWNVTNDSVLVMEGEGVGPLRVEADRQERDELFFVDDPVVVTDREFAFAKLDVLLDAMKQFLERLHGASFMMRRNRCWCIPLRLAVFSVAVSRRWSTHGLEREFRNDQPLTRNVDCRQLPLRLIR